PMSPPASITSHARTTPGAATPRPSRSTSVAWRSGRRRWAAVVRERQDLARRWRSLDAAIVAAANRPPDRRDAAAETELRQQLATRRKRCSRGDEAMLVYLTAADRSWLWAVRRDRAAFL